MYLFGQCDHGGMEVLASEVSERKKALHSDEIELSEWSIHAPSGSCEWMQTALTLPDARDKPPPPPSSPRLRSPSQTRHDAATTHQPLKLGRVDRSWP